MNNQDLTLNHIKETCLYVHDLDKTSHFYHDLLGLPIIGRKENRHIFFRVGDQVLLCFIADSTKNEDRFPAHYASGKQHMAFGVPPEEYPGWRKRILSLEIDITCEFQWRENLWSFYFEDPDGNVLEIVPNNLWDD